MELIIDFYKSLDTLNLIIFWGIIIVIILLLTFSCILINKNKKLKSMVEKNNQYEDDLPIKKEEKDQKKENIIETELEILPQLLPEIEETNNIESNDIDKMPEIEKTIVIDEPVNEYQKDISLSNTNKTDEYKEKKININPTIEMPTGPYQRNVLREMSLSQTSPIGINRQEKREEKKIEMARDLEASLSNEEIEETPEIEKEEARKEIIQKDIKYPENQIKKELSNIESFSPRKTEIKSESKVSPELRHRETYEEKRIEREERKIMTPNIYNTNNIESPASELLNSQPRITEEKKEKSSSEKYLEEVSRKLAEAEIPDEIERTNYELKQEEDAIISYKELMEKKDSIQTIDEEEAVISIEELMNRNNQKQEETENNIEESKLYKISDDEENDNFIKELKQFRNDL